MGQHFREVHNPFLAPPLPSPLEGPELHSREVLSNWNTAEVLAGDTSSSRFAVKFNDLRDL